VSGQLAYTAFETDIGWIAILGTAAGLRRVTLPHRSRSEAIQCLGGAAEQALRDDTRFANLAKRLKDFFHGDRPGFPDTIDFSGATAFQRAVWEAARQIPYGEARSYGDLAEQVGRPGAARAVGQCMARNPVAVVIPCHRVVASGGRLGGFGGGEDLKRYLLEMEASAPGR